MPGLNAASGNGDIEDNGPLLGGKTKEQLEREEKYKNGILMFLALMLIFSSIAGIWFFTRVAKANNSAAYDSFDYLQAVCRKDRASELSLKRQFPDVVKKNWPAYGRDFAGTRYNPFVDKISVHSSTDGLQSHVMVCDSGSTSGVSATITYDDEGVAYYPTWGDLDASKTISNAQIVAKHTENCNNKWLVDVKDIAADPHTAVRSSISLFEDSVGTKAVFFCDLGTPNFTCSSSNATLNNAQCGAYCYALRRDTGALMWRTQVSSQASAQVTGSPTIVGQTAYFGLSTRSEGLLKSNSYHTYTFYGEAYSMNLNTGELVYAQPTIFSTGNVTNTTGASVWGSPIPYDVASETVVFGSGNLDTVSANITACMQTNGKDAFSCLPNDVWPDSLMAVRAPLSGHPTTAMSTPLAMQEKWVFSAQGVDAWNLACESSPKGANCPAVPGSDYDFAAGAIIITNECGEKRVVALQKSGALWSFDLNTGEQNWRTYVGPGNTLDNSWGMAYDGEYFYIGFGNYGRKYYRTLDGTIRCDAFTAAVHAWSGEIAWVTPMPNSRKSGECGTAVADSAMTRWFTTEELLFADRGVLHYASSPAPAGPNPEPDTVRDDSLYSVISGATTVANGVVYVTSWNGYTYLLNAANGEIFAAMQRCEEGSVYGGVTASRYWNGNEYVDQIAYGCGYDHVPGPLAGSKVIFYNFK